MGSLFFIMTHGCLILWLLMPLYSLWLFMFQAQDKEYRINLGIHHIFKTMTTSCTVNIADHPAA
jgi:hypothetical protein